MLVNLLALVRMALVLLTRSLVVAVRVHWRRVARVAGGGSASRPRALPVRVVLLLVEVRLRVWVHQLLANLLTLLLGSSGRRFQRGASGSGAGAGAAGWRVLRGVLGVETNIRVCRASSSARGGGGRGRRVGGAGVGHKRRVLRVGSGTQVRVAQSRWGDSSLDDSLDISHEQRVQQIDNSLALGHGQGTLERNPHALQVHGPDLHHMSDLLQLQDTVTASTRHLRHVQKLGAVDHVVVGTTHHRHVVGVHLVAQGLLVLPHGGGDARTDSRRLVLAHGGIGVSAQRIRRHQALG